MLGTQGTATDLGWGRNFWIKDLRVDWPNVGFAIRVFNHKNFLGRGQKERDGTDTARTSEAHSSYLLPTRRNLAFRHRPSTIQAHAHELQYAASRQPLLVG